MQYIYQKTLHHELFKLERTFIVVTGELKPFSPLLSDSGP
jgi:hypothetical protein